VIKMKISNKNYINRLIANDQRPDARKFDEFRKIEIETGVIKTAEGSARVKMGKTELLAGVKMSIAEPYPDIPNEGVLSVNAELSPISSSDFEPGPPTPEGIEMARVIDRGIRESKCMEVEKLCIEPGEKVWRVNVDIHVLNHDGNLIDAGGLAAIAALMTTNIPKIEDDRVLYGEVDKPLEIKDVPIPITTTKIAGKLILDPSVEEEKAAEARITLTSTREGNLCSIQKGGNGYLTKEEIEKAADLSILKGKELRQLLGV
jgi:exosome complex component RRP42